MIAPVPVQDIHQGRAAFLRHLEAALKEGSLVDKGWFKLDDLTLLVPMFASTQEGQADLYLLRLVFDHYPKGPPSAQFINPMTLSYSYPQDVQWVPRSEGAPDIAFHPNYSGVQLICSSTTLEFYKVNHEVNADHVWNPERMNFLSTLAAVRRGLAPAYYRGRSTQ